MASSLSHQIIGNQLIIHRAVQNSRGDLYDITLDLNQKNGPVNLKELISRPGLLEEIQILVKGNLGALQKIQSIENFEQIGFRVQQLERGSDLSSVAIVTSKVNESALSVLKNCTGNFNNLTDVSIDLHSKWQSTDSLKPLFPSEQAPQSFTLGQGLDLLHQRLGVNCVVSLPKQNLDPASIKKVVSENEELEEEISSNDDESFVNQQPSYSKFDPLIFVSRNNKFTGDSKENSTAFPVTIAPEWGGKLINFLTKHYNEWRDEVKEDSKWKNIDFNNLMNLDSNEDNKKFLAEEFSKYMSWERNNNESEEPVLIGLFEKFKENVGPLLVTIDNGYKVEDKEDFVNHIIEKLIELHTPTHTSKS